MEMEWNGMGGNYRRNRGTNEHRNLGVLGPLSPRLFVDLSQLHYPSQLKYFPVLRPCGLFDILCVGSPDLEGPTWGKIGF